MTAEIFGIGKIILIWRSPRCPLLRKRLFASVSCKFRTLCKFFRYHLWFFLIAMLKKIYINILSEVRYEKKTGWLSIYRSMVVLGLLREYFTISRQKVDIISDTSRLCRKSVLALYIQLTKCKLSKTICRYCSMLYVIFTVPIQHPTPNSIHLQKIDTSSKPNY